MVQKIDSYAQEFRKYIPEQYKHSTKLLAVVDAFLSQCDDLETALFEILNCLDTSQATGVSLDYIGALVGVSRESVETDASYRQRILMQQDEASLPTYPAIRSILKKESGCSAIGLYPDLPAGLYYVPTGSIPDNLNLDNAELAPSGVDMGQGTFLVAEDGEGYGYIVQEDNLQPIVIDHKTFVYNIITSDGEHIVTSGGDTITAFIA